MANEPGRAQLVNLDWLAQFRIVVYRFVLCGCPDLSSLEWDVREGESPVEAVTVAPRGVFKESGCLGLQP